MNNDKNMRDTDRDPPRGATQTLQRRNTERGEIEDARHTHQEDLQPGERIRPETGAGE